VVRPVLSLRADGDKGKGKTDTTIECKDLHIRRHPTVPAASLSSEKAHNLFGRLRLGARYKLKCHGRVWPVTCLFWLPTGMELYATVHANLWTRSRACACSGGFAAARQVSAPAQAIPYAGWPHQVTAPSTETPWARDFAKCNRHCSDDREDLERPAYGGSSGDGACDSWKTDDGTPHMSSSRLEGAA